MKKTLRKSIGILLVLVMLLSTLSVLSFTAFAAPLIQNGSFDNGTTGFVIEKAGYANAVVETVDDGKGGKMLNIDTKDAAGTLHAFRVYQTVSVAPKTDYVWEIELGVPGQGNNYLGVVAGDTVKANGNTTLAAKAEVVSGNIKFTSPIPNAVGAQLIADGTAVDPNWLEFGWTNGWSKVKITFNSGDNTKVSLAYGARHTGRIINTDNWALYKDPKVGRILNGNFENGMVGWTGNAATKEIVTESGNSILHAIGGGNVKQEVAVKANTDYVFSFRTKKADSQGVIYANIFAADGTTNLATAIENLQVPDNFNFAGIHATNGAQFNSRNAEWNDIKVYFNSGDNTSIIINFNLWAATRDRYFDDLCLYESPKVGEIVNGDFENGTAGFTRQDVATFEVIEEPENTANSVLHLIGPGIYYQNVAVEKNTDYIWTFRMKDLGNTGTTRILVTPKDTLDNMVTSIEQGGGGYASANDGTYASAATYNKAWVNFTVKFNSGENEVIKLLQNTWANNRDIYMDDWSLEKAPVPGELKNGSFDEGTKGYTNMDMATFEVIAEPENTSNNVLHLIGPGKYYQNVAVEKNTDYIWTFRMKDLGNTGTTRIYVHPNSDWSNIITEMSHSGNGYSSINDGSYASAATYNKAWVTFTVKFNSGDNEFVKLLQNTWANTREIYMDDWSLEKAPLVGELRNGDFENGLKYFVVSDKAVAEASTENVYADTYSAKVGGKEGATAFGQFMYQQVLVKPNTDYVWSFWYKSNAQNTTLVGVRTADGKNLLPSFVNTDAFVAPGDESFVALRDTNKDNWHETLYNTNWKQYKVVFNSGDNEAVLLSFDFITSARNGFTDNWTLKEYTFISGDADNDGTVDAKDLAEIRRHLLGKAKFYKGGIDVNGDGKFNILDLVSAKKKLAEISPLDGYSLVWADDFGGQYLDKSKWTYGSHMNEKEDLELRYDETGIAVADGSATLYAGRVDENNYYTNAALTTCNTDGSIHIMSFKYGYVEMRAKIPLGAPAFPSFWMKSLPKDGVAGEIDIFEHFCYSDKGDNWIQSGVHKWYTDSDHLLLDNINGKTAVDGMSLSDGGWHTYALLWTPEKLDFICDGVTYHTIDITGDGEYKVYDQDTKELIGTRTEDTEIFHDYYFLIMNNYLHTPEGVKGTDHEDSAATPDTELPLEYEIDYVRLYQNEDGAIRLGALQ